MAVVAQFLYVAAQAGIFSFFINYMTSQVRRFLIRGTRAASGSGWFSGWFEIHHERRARLQQQGGARIWPR